MRTNFDNKTAAISYEASPYTEDMRRSSLTSTDLQGLFDSFITPALALRAGLCRVDDEAGAETVGRKRRAGYEYAGIRFSFFWPGNPHPREYSLRRDNPDEKFCTDGELKEEGKYLWPPGRPPLFYFPPDVDPAWLSDVSMPIVFVEGEKKCLAMWRAACLLMQITNASYPLFLPIGLRGVWSWKRQQTNGNRKVSEPISDFERIKWQSRKVSILFDSNTHTNEGVQAARDHLGAHTKELGADTFIAEMPHNCGVNGPDDLLGTIAREDDPESAAMAINTILDAAQPAITKRELREKYAVRDWVVLNDIANLMMSEWGWDDADRVTYSAINSSWGGRATKTFRTFLIVIFQRMQKLPDVPILSEKKAAERFTRNRIKKLKATIKRTVDFPLLEHSPGGQRDPKTGKRLGSQFKVNHKPFLEAYRLYQELVEQGGNPGRAREEAAKDIARKYALSPAEAEEREAQEQAKIEAESTDDDELKEIYRQQIAFEKLINRRAEELRSLMAGGGYYTQGEIENYFNFLGGKIAEIGKRHANYKRLKEQRLAESRGTAQCTPKAQDVTTIDECSLSTPPNDMKIGNGDDEWTDKMAARDTPSLKAEVETPKIVAEQICAGLPVEEIPPSSQEKASAQAHVLPFNPPIFCEFCGARILVDERNCSHCHAPNHAAAD